eukprot:Skav222095  [mRNA]  locus=scaffold2165:257232:261715:- [translate_table: standard]
MEFLCGLALVPLSSWRSHGGPSKKVPLGVSLSEVQLARTLAEEKPKDALEQEPELSVAEKAAEDESKSCAQSFMLLRPGPLGSEPVRSPSDPLAAPKVLGVVQNYLEDKETKRELRASRESYHLAMSLRKLAAESGLESLRLWGKARLSVLGTMGDYYVAEGTLGAAETIPVALPGSPDDDARSMKHMLSGDLSSEVISTPWFPGQAEELKALAENEAEKAMLEGIEADLEEPPSRASKPEDIMDEPDDLDEHEEPNPIQEEAESDKAGTGNCCPLKEHRCQKRTGPSITKKQ